MKHRDCDSIHRTCMSSNQTKSLHGEAEVNTKPHPLPRNYNLYLLKQRQSAFSSRVALGWPYSKAGTLPKSSGLTKKDSMCFVWVLLFLFVCFIIGFLFVFFYFCFFKKEKKKMNLGGGVWGCKL